MLIVLKIQELIYGERYMGDYTMVKAPNVTVFRTDLEKANVRMLSGEACNDTRVAPRHTR